MSDKVFNLMEEMYIEFSQFRGEMTGFKHEMIDFKHDTNNRLTKIEIKLENEIPDMFKALFDDRAEMKQCKWYN